MLRKIIITSLIMCIFLVAMISPVSAIDKELEDGLDDVIDMVESSETDEVYTDEKPNIDIHKIFYTKEGKTVTITMQMHEDGVIENRGDIENEKSLDMVSYMCALTMSERDYDIVYINGSATLDEEEEAISFVIEGNKITFTFDVDSENEEYQGIYTATVDSALKGLTNFYMYADEFTDLDEELICDAGGPYKAKPGESVSFTASATGGMKPYTYSWDFGDGETSSQQNPTHTFDEEGNTKVTLTVTDALLNTCTKEVTAQISSDGNGDDSEGNIMIFLALIAIIVIIGVAVVIFVMRR